MKLDKEKVNSLFEELPTCEDVIIALYKRVFPEWDNIEKVNGWPRVNKETANQLCNRFMEKQRKLNKSRHPNEQIMPGGMWLNNGFGCSDSEHLNDWEVDTSEVELIMEKGT